MNNTRIQLRNAFVDFLTPLLFDLNIRFNIETIEQRICQSGAGIGRKGEGLLEKFNRLFIHDSILRA